MLYLKDFPGNRVGYSIFNVLGQEVASGTSNGNISVATLEKGIYLLQINDGNVLRTTRFVVK
ncbi:MAG: T9SS type A sorting domain-containing protein [Bacteroidales bacterium]|nr:T9SS type A sorting domain-containing protein [Bacteroidales bacterium]